MRRPRATGWSCLLVALASAGVARAGPADGIGVLPEDTALGGSFAARGGSIASIYFNPAGLAPGGDVPPDAPGFAEIDVAFLASHPVLYAERESGAALPLVTTPRDTAGFWVGTRFDLGHPLGVEGLHMGIATYLPTSGVFFWAIHPDEAPQWLFLTDRAASIAVHAGLAWRALPWLSLGLGLRMLFDVETHTTGRVKSIGTRVDPTTGDDLLEVKTQLGEDVTVYGRAVPDAGVLFTPLAELRIGLAYRAQSYVDDWGWTRIQGVPGFGDLGYRHHFAHYFEPHQATVAVEVEPVPELSLSVDLTYARWTDGLTTEHNALGPGRFGDTLVPAFGAGWRATPGLRLLAGYRYVRSPFDDFGGPTNLLDNDQHVASLGAEVELGVVESEGLRFSASWAVRSAFLVRREEQKDPRYFASDRAFLANAGREPYAHGGTVPGISLGLEAGF